MIEQHYLDDSLFQLRKLKTQADKAMAQVDDSQFFALIDEGANSIALVVKHMTGNMRSRWTDFLTSDGEKPDRHRDSEFELESTDTRDAMLARWEAAWDLLFRTIGALEPGEEPTCLALLEEGVLVQPGYFYDFEGGAFLVLSLLQPPDVFEAALAPLVRVLGR